MQITSKQKEISEIMIKIAEYVDVDDWDDVLDLLGQMNKESYTEGYLYRKYLTQFEKSEV